MLCDLIDLQKRCMVCLETHAQKDFHNLNNEIT